MISQKVRDKLIEQVKAEWESDFFYLAMMAWCFNNDYDGFGNWFYNQANEERGHGLRILQYVTDVGGDISVPSVDVPRVAFEGLEHIFKLQLEHEEEVTKRVHELVNLSVQENDHSTHTFLQWFIKEQIEEESTARNLLAKVRRAEGSPGVLLMLESELAKQRAAKLPGSEEDDG